MLMGNSILLIIFFFEFISSSNILKFLIEKRLMSSSSSMVDWGYEESISITFILNICALFLFIENIFWALFWMNGISIINTLLWVTLMDLFTKLEGKLNFIDIVLFRIKSRFQVFFFVWIAWSSCFIIIVILVSSSNFVICLRKTEEFYLIWLHWFKER